MYKIIFNIYLMYENSHVYYPWIAYNFMCIFAQKANNNERTITLRMG